VRVTGALLKQIIQQLIYAYYPREEILCRKKLVFCMHNRGLAVEGNGHEPDKSGTFSRPLSLVKDQKPLKEVSGTKVKLKSRIYL
jgi:hypothetical protein